MEWNWCAARGPAAITHYKPIQPRHSIICVWFVFSLVGLALSSISSLNQFHSTLWMNWWRWKEGKRRVGWPACLPFGLVACGLQPPLTHPKSSPMGHQSLPLCCRASCFAKRKTQLNSSNLISFFLCSAYAWGPLAFFSSLFSINLPIRKRRLMEEREKSSPGRSN